MVVVVDGVMSIPGDGNAVHKAKDHSHGYSEKKCSRDTEGGVHYLKRARS